jgi:two-component system cell cycle sensor histidine kinase/response regulator CckA
VAMDVTARRRAEDALQRAHAELEQQVEERTSELAQANRMLKILSDCNQTVVRATEEPALLQDVCRIIVELGGYPLVWIGFAEQDAAQTVRPMAQAGFEDGYLESVNITWADTERGQGPTGRAIRSGQPCVARDIQTDPYFAPWREDAIRRGYASSIALPLWGNDRVFGALNIYAPVADAFHAEEVHLLMELANNLAIGITSLREREERKRAEEAVRESGARYRAIVEAFDGQIYVCSPDYRVEFMNRQLVERTGYDGTGQLCYQVLHELDSICPWCVNNRVFAGETVRWEVQSPKDNRWFYVVNTPIYHTDGSMSKQSMFLDITERKLAEDELRQNREDALQFSEQLAALQEVANELSKAESFDDLCLLAVQLGRSRLGFDRVSIWFIEEHLGIMRGSFGTDERGELRDERKAQVEFRHDGLAWHLFSQKEPMALVEHCPLCDHLGREVGEGDNAVAALWDGDEVIGVICVDNLFSGQSIRERQLEVLRLYATTLGHLITRKRAEDELRASETRFRTFLDHAADTFLLHDGDEQGTILDVNRQACESLGYSREELIGRTAFDFDPSLDHSFVGQNRARLDAGEVLVFDTQHRRKDGTVFPVEIRVRPFWQGEHRFAVSLARDITERKQAEEALTLFRSLIDHANDIIEVADPETGRFLDVNERACLAHGYTHEEYLALTVPQINVVMATRSWKETVEELRCSGSLIRESQHRRKDGSIFPVEINISYIRLDRDYVLSVVRDITQRKQAEEALRESEQKYRFITEKMADAVWLMDMDFKPTFISPSVTRIFGYTLEELRTLPLDELLSPESLEFAMKTMTTELSAERLAPRPHERSVTVELEFRRKDGSLSWSESTITLLTDSEGRPTGLMGVGRDITGRKKAEEALRESEERYRVLYEDNPSMYFTVDPDGIVLSVNQFGCEQLGYTASELVGESVLNVFHDEDINAAAESVARCAENPGQVFHWELRKVHKAGNVLWVKETARAMRGPDGQVVVFIVCEDITERKLAEKERENLQAQLFQAQKMEVLGRLAGGVAHDFNNMLFAILGHTELALRLSNPADPIYDYLKVIEESTYRSADLVRQLLAFARQQTVAPKVLDLNDTVAGMLKMLRRLIGEDIHLVWMPGAGLWPVRIDPSQIDQLLANLCVNARDAISGVGKVTIETRNAIFDEAYCAVHPGFVCGQFVLLAVSDDGCGMTQDVIAHLFEPFFTTKEMGKGTGLGLATVYGIVRQNEGFINVYSEPGEGSTFKIYLPRFEGQSGELDAASVAEMLTSHGETVLLVEDDAAILKLGQTMLQELGYKVLAADTPSQALHQAEAYTGEIQLLITDVVMPEMSGRALAQVLGKIRPALKVLFTSGYTGDVISHHGVLDEGVHFLQKPFSMRDLASKVREVLEQELTDRNGR